MSTEARLERLEKELTATQRRYHRLRFLVVGLAAAGVALAWKGSQGISGSAQEEVRADRFVLVDEDGTVRGAWDSSGEGVGVALYDQLEQIRLSLAVSTTGPYVHLDDQSGEIRAQLAVSETGPSLRLYDQSGEIRTQVGVGGAKASDGRTITYPESSIRLAGPDGNVVWSAPR